MATSTESSDVTCLRVMPSHVMPVMPCQSVIMTLSDQRLIDKDGNLVETPPGCMEESILDLTDRFGMRITKRDCKFYDFCAMGTAPFCGGCPHATMLPVQASGKMSCPTPTCFSKFEDGKKMRVGIHRFEDLKIP